MCRLDRLQLTVRREDSLVSWTSLYLQSHDVCLAVNWGGILARGSLLPRLASFYSSLSPSFAFPALIFHLWLHASATPHLSLSNVLLALLYKSIRGVRRENAARTRGPFHPGGTTVQDAVGKQVPSKRELWVEPVKWNWRLSKKNEML